MAGASWVVLGGHRDTAVAGDGSLDARRPFFAARWGLVACAAALLAGALGCAAAAPADATVALRDGASDGDGEAETEGIDATPAAPKTNAAFAWIADESEGVARSKAERRPMLVHFSAEWCSACKRLAEETFGDPQFKTQAGRFVAVHIDATNDEDPQVNAAFSKYAVLGVPTIIVLDSRGREHRRFTDFIRADKLLGEMETVR